MPNDVHADMLLRRSRHTAARDSFLLGFLSLALVPLSAFFDVSVSSFSNPAFFGAALALAFRGAASAGADGYQHMTRTFKLLVQSVHWRRLDRRQSDIGDMPVSGVWT
jgi:hypothetical protein